MRIVVAVVLAVLLVTGCNSSPDEPGDGDAVTGPITKVEPLEGDIESFTVDSDDGDEIEIFIDPDRDYGFDLIHLHEHHSTQDPVEVRLESRDGVLYATSIEDV